MGGDFGSPDQIAFPTGSKPGNIAPGLDGMFVTLEGTGQLAVFGPHPYSDRTFTIAASGIEGPRGLIQRGRTMLVAAHDGDRLVEVPQAGQEGAGTDTPTDIPLPPGFHPNRLATPGDLLYPGETRTHNDVWVTDDETAQVAASSTARPTRPSPARPRRHLTSTWTPTATTRSTRSPSPP